MNTGQNDGNKPEILTVRVQNVDTVTLPAFTPVYLNFTTTPNATLDGVGVQRPSVALGAGIGESYGMVITPNLLPNQFGDCIIFGVVANVPVIANTRANTGTAYGTQSAVSAGAGLTVDTTNNYYTALTLITKSQSNTAPAILLDAIAANTGNGTTPAAGLFLTVPVRCLIRAF